MPLNKQKLFNNSEISQQTFLQDYWHKKPLLLKNAISLQHLEVLPNKQKLMQLSCDEDIQSRVVFKQSATVYDVEIGPFVKEDLRNFADYCWNLLISDVDKWLPKSREILSYFSFIRNWIFDDIMLSTGSTGGTVGPHTDHYDVFLVQVYGQRQWQYADKKKYNPKLIPEQDLKLMQDFKADETFILNAGDVLYLPPEIPHYGIAHSDDCVTCSVGIRTPSHAELLTSFVDNIAQNISANHRFTEPQFATQPKSGEITQSDIDNISTIINDNLVAKNITSWFGKFITEYRSIFHEYSQSQNIKKLNDNMDLTPSPFSKTCYFKQQNNAILFVNGENFNISLTLAKLICDDKLISNSTRLKLNPNEQTVVEELFKNGSLLNSTKQP